MDSKGTRYWGLTVLAIAFSLVSMVSIAQAGVITAVTVTVGTTTFDIWGGSIGAGVNVTGKTAVFTQNSTTVGLYNFDSSDVSCPTICVPFVSVTIGGVVYKFLDNVGGNNVLHANQLDPGGNLFNESHEWLALLSQVEASGDLLQVSVGYADSAHSNACADTNANCHPDGPWTNADFFFGLAQTGGCTGAHGDPCFDAGAILITEIHRVVTPEPSSMVLLGAGLIALAAWGRRRLRSQE